MDVLRGRLSVSDTGGPAPPFVFLHGTGCDSADWSDVAACLPAAMRIVRIDFRGHGKSAVPSARFSIDDLADDVLAVMSDLKLPPAVLVGHSLGGMVALRAAARSPLVGGLVLLEGWTTLKASEAFAPGHLYGGLPAAAVESIQGKSRRTLSRFPVDVWEHFWSTVKAFDASSYLTASRLRILEVYGDRGRMEGTRERLLVPDRENIEMVWIPGAGHYLPHEVPRQVARIVAALR